MSRRRPENLNLNLLLLRCADTHALLLSLQKVVKNPIKMDEKKKRQHNYRACSAGSKKKRNSGLECGMQGFLCTTNFREKDCVREAYNILNEFLEKLKKPNDTVVSFL